MSRIHYSPVFDDLVITGAGTTSMRSSFSQDSFLRRKSSQSPLWRGTYVSKNDDFPLWKRGDVLRSVDFNDLFHKDFSGLSITEPASVLTTTGELSLRPVQKNMSILFPDKELYHYNKQRMFALFAQFNVLTDQQISAFLNIPVEEVVEHCTMLYAAGVLDSPQGGWKHDDTLGTVWRMKLGKAHLQTYYNRMDSLSQMLSLGGLEPKDASPGSNTMSSLRHNLFMAEICLRIAECSDNIVGVWGDYYASGFSFYEPIQGYKTRKSHGDAVLVNRDGGLIILELSTSREVGANKAKLFAEKAASWSGIIAQSPLDISVIFVDTNWSTNKKTLLRALQAGLSEYAPEYNPDKISRDKALSKIGLVDATWWFPSDGVVSQAATRVMAYKPQDRKYGAFDISVDDGRKQEFRENIIINSAAALHTPPWIRHESNERQWKGKHNA